MGGRGSASPLGRTRHRGARRILKNIAAAAASGARRRLYGGQTATTELITLPDGRRAVHKTPRSEGDDPDTIRFLMDGEELAPRLAEVIGAPIARTYRDAPDSIWVEYIDGTHEGADRLVDSPAGVRIGLLDALTGYTDRSGLIAHRGQLTAYDNGGAWLLAELGDPAPHLADPKAPMKHLVAGDTWRTDPPLSRAELDRLRPQIEALRPVFSRAGRGAWLDYSLAALDQIRRRAT